jgi:hypothetical protein
MLRYEFTPRSKFVSIGLIGVIVVLAAISGGAFSYFRFNVGKSVEVYTPTTTPNHRLSFNWSEITKAGELKFEGNYVADLNVRFIDKEHGRFSDLLVTRKIDGISRVLYSVSRDGMYSFGEPDRLFIEDEYGGFGGYQLHLIANDFFVIRYLGKDESKVSSPIIVHWNPEKKQFESTLKIPKVVEDIITGKDDTTGKITE